jgi:hypothetical protein
MVSRKRYLEEMCAEADHNRSSSKQVSIVTNSSSDSWNNHVESNPAKHLCDAACFHNYNHSCCQYWCGVIATKRPTEQKENGKDSANSSRRVSFGEKEFHPADIDKKIVKKGDDGKIRAVKKRETILETKNEDRPAAEVAVEKCLPRRQASQSSTRALRSSS